MGPVHDVRRRRVRLSIAQPCAMVVRHEEVRDLLICSAGLGIRSLSDRSFVDGVRRATGLPRGLCGRSRGVNFDQDTRWSEELSQVGNSVVVAKNHVVGRSFSQLLGEAVLIVGAKVLEVEDQ